ncbi:MAG: hypothetical protein Q9M50_11480 [Methylococcales bacterium]|nr:hypothetical protein [Methylococcales bacterium]
MSYSDFTLKKIKQDLGIKVIEDEDLFSPVEAVKISDYLTSTLKYNLPLAMALGTEKARSELVIANVLLEVRKKLDNKVSFFSGINLDVDKSKSLTGFCDFIMSQSSEQFYMSSPIITVVEAKNESIGSGLGQCIAEMYASSLFNDKEGTHLSVIYGAVTTGSTWRFLRYENKKAYIDLPEYYIADVTKIMGILVSMMK